MTKKQRHTVESYDIRQVIELTGVSEFTLRGWELRYNAIVPERTATGRRRYSQADLLKIQVLRQLVSEGNKISSVAALSNQELQDLVADRNLNSISVPVDIRKLISYADQFQWQKVEASIRENLSKRGERPFIHDFLLPLISVMNQQVEAGRWTIIQEHIISAFIREQLYAIKGAVRNVGNKKMRIVFATPENDFHDIGILIASTLARLHLVPALYLGPNVPKEELCQACIKFKATDLVIASTLSKDQGAKDEIPKLVHFIDRQLPSKLNLLAAGLGFQSAEFRLKRLFVKLTSMQNFEGYLERAQL